MHGGGFVQGSPETHDEIAVGIVARTGQTVISIDYSLAPERPFPAAVLDCEAVIYWVFETADDLGIRADAVSVGDYHVAKNVTWALTGTPGDDDAMMALLEPYTPQRHRAVMYLEAAGMRRPRRAPRFSPRDYRKL